MATVRGGGNVIIDGLIFYVDPLNRYSYISGNTTTYNLMSDDYNGILTGGTSFDNESFDFDGVDGAIDFGVIPELNSVNKLSISFWVKVPNFSTLVRPLGRRLPLYDAVTFKIQTTGKVDFNIHFGAVRTDDALSIDTWYNIVGVYDGTEPDNLTKCKIYINGELQSTTSVGSITPTTTGPGTGVGFAIGAEGIDTGFVSHLNGNIGITKIYNKVLSQSEISQNYNTFKSRYGLT